MPPGKYQGQRPSPPPTQARSPEAQPIQPNSSENPTLRAAQSQGPVTTRRTPFKNRLASRSTSSLPKTLSSLVKDQQIPPAPIHSHPAKGVEFQILLLLALAPSSIHSQTLHSLSPRRSAPPPSARLRARPASASPSFPPPFLLLILRTQNSLPPSPDPPPLSPARTRPRLPPETLLSSLETASPLLPSDALARDGPLHCATAS